MPAAKTHVMSVSSEKREDLKLKANGTERLICAHALNPENKRRLWEGIKRTEPILADALKNDQGIKALIDTFNAAPVFAETQARLFIQAGTQEHKT